MTVIIDGTTGISPVTASGTSASVDGLTVGRGGGEVATNTVVGASALVSNITATENTAVGYTAGYSTTTGGANAFVGNRAGYSNTTGYLNTFVGNDAGRYTTTGINNTALGANALQTNTTASNNTAVGFKAGYANVTGEQCTYVGAFAGSNTTGTYNTFVGYGAGYQITSGTKNTIVGQYNGNQAGLNITTSSNYIVLSDGDGNPRIWTDNTGLMYVPQARLQTTANASNLYVDSSYWIARSTSALKYKQDIRTLESIDVNKFRPVRYKSACENDDQEKDHFGIIADEVDEAGFKELVSYGADGEVEGFQYERFTVVLLKAIQELKAELDATKAEVQALKDK